MKEIVLGDIRAEVVLKDIKNVHLSVYPPSGRVRIAAPLRMDMETIRIFTLSKLGWIKKQQKKFREQEREKTREYVNRESHYFLGKRYLLSIQETAGVSGVKLKGNRMELYVRPESSQEKRKQVLERWYRAELKRIAADLLPGWEKRMKVKVRELGIRKMKTKWGTCNGKAGRVWLNLDLAKKPAGCIEYILVHEMTHLLERRHNERFLAYMDRHLPQWREVKKELNRLPISKY